MNQIHQQLGVPISIDDFGTGYSSLNYLKRIPTYKLKIDRTFIEDVSHNKDDAVIVGAIIAMAHSLNLIVVAEGIETAEQLAFIQEKGCDIAQGFYFARPMPAEYCMELLTDWNG